MDNRGQDSQSTDERLKIAVEIDSLLRRPNGREIFRKYTRQAAQQYMAAREKLQLREKRRLEELKKNGVLHSVEELPSPPDGDKSKWLEWVETVRGSWSGTVGAEASTPPNRLAEFHLIKELKFPKDIDGNCEYAFDLHGWIPEELSQKHDPSVDLPLPIPDRMLGLIEKFAGLSALYDAWFLGTEKIAPWGTVDPNKSEVRSGLTHGISEEEAFQASWYYHLVEAAKVFEAGEMPCIRTWLTDVQSQLAGEQSNSEKSLKHNSCKSIQPENRSRPLQMQEAAKLYKQSNAWLRKCMDEGTIAYERHSRQSYFFDVTQFPADNQDKAR
ncbi:hypothetical protein N9B60_05570 [Mariniblastus sp.]|nr:hypothetical protein [Mariniblastus sp.]